MEATSVLSFFWAIHNANKMVVRLKHATEIGFWEKHLHNWPKDIFLAVSLSCTKLWGFAEYDSLNKTGNWLMCIRDWHFDIETSPFRDFCQFFRVSVSVSENLVSEKKSQFRKIWSRKKVSVSVSESLVSTRKSRLRKIWSQKKSLGFSFREFGLWKKFRFRKIWSRKKVLVLVSENLISEKKKTNNNKDTRPSKQRKSLFWIMIFFCFTPIY